MPEWFRDAKFGIWSHWGPQSVAMAGDWYARHLYGPYEGTEDWERERAERQHALHLRRFGPSSLFGHKDLCHLWRAERFDPGELMDLYRRAGARYFVALAAHCDNFDLWDSAHQPWNSVNVGPRSDIVRRWADAAEAEGMHFGVSMHAGSWTWRWLDAAFTGDGGLTREDGPGTWWEGLDPADLYGRPRRHGEPPDAAFIANFYARLDDLVARFRPELIYLDDERLPFDEGSVCPAVPTSREGLRFLGRYYGAVPAGIASIKRVSDEDRGAVLLDRERSQLEALDAHPWQLDTSIGDWFYREGERYKTPRHVIHQLVDTVSKNGCLLLNIVQRPDGTIDDESRALLEEVGGWLSVNGEGVYGTRPWQAFGEGPTPVPSRGRGWNEDERPYTSRDLRFMSSGEALYATLMAWPEDGVARIESRLERRPSRVDLLGHDAPLAWRLEADALTVDLPPEPPTPHAHTLRIR